MGLDGKDVNTETMENGFVGQAENGHVINGNHAGSSASFRTYKRRKRAQAEECPKSSGESAAQIKEKSTKELADVDFNECSCSQANVAGNGSNVSIPVHHDSSLKSSRNIVLEQMCKSLDIDVGLMECIQGSFLFTTENDCVSKVKDSVHSFEGSRKSTSLAGPSHPGVQNEVRSTDGVTFDASMTNSDRQKVTELCKQTFSDVIMSEKFALLCNLLLENFEGIKADKLLDIGFMNSRLKEGAYEKSPGLFLSDIQQVWTKLQNFGAEIVTLSKNLSDKSRASYHEKIEGVFHGTSADGHREIIAEHSGLHTKMEQAEACGIYKLSTCKGCGGKADGRDFLVCDSCEEMYHVLCIQPAVEEIPSRSWYCASCTAKGNESPHHNCVVCERLSTSRYLINDDGADELSNAERSVELEESSTGFTDDDSHVLGGKNNTHCNICRIEIKNGEKLRICGHDFCPHKFYHARCLTSKQLESCGPRWYCPSCLCRVCLLDRDDEKIVLCDSCDLAYHIYCMEPPRTMVPRGKWFCRKCDDDIRNIRKAKRIYENMQRKRSREGKASHRDIRSENGKKEEELEKSGGVDMLLNAARTLNYEENLATRRVKS